MHIRRVIVARQFLLQQLRYFIRQRRFNDRWFCVRTDPGRHRLIVAWCGYISKEQCSHMLTVIADRAGAIAIHAELIHIDIHRIAGLTERNASADAMPLI